MKWGKKLNKKASLIIILILILICIPKNSFAINDFENLGLVFGGEEGSPQGTVDSIKLLMLLTVLSLAPAFLILTTCFTRIVVVLSFLRNSLGTQQTPPNQLLIGLAIFLTFFVMKPVYTEVMETSITPFVNEDISQEEALTLGADPMKKFMLKYTREKDLALFLRASGGENVEKPMDLPITTIIPAFAISELKLAFSMGFILFVPFLVIDMVVASILMSMGMFMLPPVMISLPFKILLFVLVDGWHLVIKSLLESFT